MTNITRDESVAWYGRVKNMPKSLQQHEEPEIRTVSFALLITEEELQSCDNILLRISKLIELIGKTYGIKNTWDTTLGSYFQIQWTVDSDGSYEQEYWTVARNWEHLFSMLIQDKAYTVFDFRNSVIITR